MLAQLGCQAPHARGKTDLRQPPLQRLLAFSREAAFARRAEELGGYDIGGCGAIHYNGP